MNELIELMKQKRMQQRLLKRATESICTAFEIDRAALVARDRRRNVADARMSLCTLLTEKQVQPDVIATLVKRNRSTVLHANRTIDALENRDKALTAKLHRARRLLNAEDYTERIAERVVDEIDFNSDGACVSFDYEYEKDGVVNLVGGDVYVRTDSEYHDSGDYDVPGYCTYSGSASIECFNLTAHLVGDVDAECDPTITVETDRLEEIIKRTIN